MASSLEEVVAGFLDGRVELAGVPVFPASKARQGQVFPYLTYQLITGRPVVSMDGFSGLSAKTIQVDVWAETYKQAKALAKVVKDLLIKDKALEGINGVQGVFLANEQDLPEPPATGQPTGIERISLDFEFWYEGV